MDIFGGDVVDNAARVDDLVDRGRERATSRVIAREPIHVQAVEHKAGLDLERDGRQLGVRAPGVDGSARRRAGLARLPVGTQRAGDRPGSGEPSRGTRRRLDGSADPRERSRGGGFARGGRFEVRVATGLARLARGGLRARVRTGSALGLLRSALLLDDVARVRDDRGEGARPRDVRSRRAQVARRLPGAAQSARFAGLLLGRAVSGDVRAGVREDARRRAFLGGVGARGTVRTLALAGAANRARRAKLLRGRAVL
mmetsp:Transcript_29924/g.97037  ORF Transcript_29924/g.97037 Transcript_29924/m.97037 type:complete len:256 (-) Transcript_29924:1848-2615(-)